MYKKKPTTNQKKIKTKTILEVMKSGADELRKAGKEDVEFESKWEYIICKYKPKNGFLKT